MPLKNSKQAHSWYAPSEALALGFSFSLSPFFFFFLLLLERSIDRNEMFGTAVVLHLMILPIVNAVFTLLRPEASQRLEVLP